MVEVVDAHDLMPKDGEGSASSFVEIDFQSQLRKTKTIPKNLNPVWNQKLLFDLDTTKNHHHQYIEVSVYNERRPIPGRNFLGSARIPCLNIVKKGEEVYQAFQLEKKWFFSSVKGEIGLKVYISPESETNSPPPSTQPPPVIPSQLQKISASNSPSTIPHNAENTNLDCKTLAALPKAQIAVVSTSIAVTTQPEKESSTLL